jgi:hypothetical protein
MSIDRTGSGRADTTRGWCLEVMSTDEIVAYTARHGRFATLLSTYDGMTQQRAPHDNLLGALANKMSAEKHPREKDKPLISRSGDILIS